MDIRHWQALCELRKRFESGQYDDAVEVVKAAWVTEKLKPEMQSSFQRTMQLMLCPRKTAQLVCRKLQLGLSKYTL